LPRPGCLTAAATARAEIDGTGRYVLTGLNAAAGAALLGKRSPDRLSRQGPEVLRWLLFEAAKTSARPSAPGYGYYTRSKTAPTRTALACRRLAGSSGSARTS
jgi:hypothetical protein